MSTPSSLHAHLTAARVERGLSVYRLAQLSGLPIGTVRDMMKTEPQAVRNWMRLWEVMGYRVVIEPNR